jgi:hypothetical protein
VLSWIGWVATAIFGISYFCKRAAVLSGVQALSALLWIGYGLMIHALPVVAANLVVATLASYSCWRRLRQDRGDASPVPSERQPG